MLILHIMASRTLGGAETYSTDVMLSLHRSGVAQCVVMPKNAPRYQELKDAGLRMAPWVLALPLRPLQKGLLRLLVKRIKPDLVHCWMRRAASLMPQTERPVRPVIGWFGGYYQPRYFKSCTHFVGVTNDITLHMVKNGVPSTHALFIPTFPDIAPLPPIDRATLATPKEARVLLALSRLHPKKGLDTLLRALKNLPECFVWLAGDGPLRRSLENLARDYGVIDRVRFLGWRTDRAALLRAADICVLPSRYEPFGTVILEAWASGTPLVACNSAGPVAHVIDGENGLLTPIDDDVALAQAIRRLLDDEGLRRRMIAQGFAAYNQGYTREAVTQQWLALYRRLIEAVAVERAADQATL
jgi:glycosyltransferase involved in cell wall biosynthesis